MKRLTVSVDDVATFRYVLNDTDFDPVRFAVLCEMAGVQGISLTMADTQKGIQERDAQILKQVHKTFLNLHIPPEPQFVKLALSINPDMVTFVNVARGMDVKISPLSAGGLLEMIPDVLPDFHANNISVAVFCYPEINTLKQLTRIKVDYVEFDCTSITMANDSNDEIVALDELNTACLAAAKLGIGVNCFGGIDYAHLAELSRIPRLEDICMGLSILKRSFFVGVDQSVKEALQRILAYSS